MLKRITFLFGILVFSHFCFAQSQIITTGNNVVDPTNPIGADIVIGSNTNGGTRHDASIMWWSNLSASRISNTYDVFYFSVWNTTNANVALSAAIGGSSYFQGNVLIGQTTQRNSAYKLDVLGTVRANSIVVNSTGADFVFEPSYKLITLPTLEQYIEQNHHLPEIASAKEMQTSGVDLGQNQVKLLQKVEELTLYLIDKDKQLNEEKEVNSVQETKIDSQTGIIKQLAEQLKSQQAQINELKLLIKNQHK